MHLTKLPVLRCHSDCPHCGNVAEFSLFESGPGGDFATFVGEQTGNLYRIALGKVQYSGNSLPSLLAPAIELEGSSGALRQIPESVLCEVCGNVFGTQSMPIDGEAIVNAYEL